jgi:single stranded DNA-binding protein
MNTVTLAGNLVADATQHTAASGRTFMAFTLAHNRVWYDKKKEKQQRTTYFECLDSREGHAKYITDLGRKGNHVVVIGSVDIIQTEKNGTKYTNVKIIVDELHLSQKSNVSRSPVSNEEIADDCPF